MPFGTSVKAPMVVADLPSLEGMSINDPALDQGAVVKVVSNGFYYGLFLGSGLPLSPIDVRPTLIGGDSRWLKLNIAPGSAVPAPDPSALLQPIWYIDAINGDDDNVGDTPETALRTHAELERRIGRGTLQPPAGPGGYGTVTVHILTDLPDSDPVNIDWTLGHDVLMHYTGTVQGTTVSGSFTAVVDKDPALNDPFLLTDAAIAGGSWAPYIGRRVRITSGPRANTVMWVATASGTTMSPSDPALPNAMDPTFEPDAWSFIDVTPETPEVGDPYAVEELCEVTLGKVQLQSAGTTTVSVPLIAFGEFKFRNNMATSKPETSIAVLSFYSCCFEQSIELDVTIAALIDCRVASSVLGSGGGPTILSGLIGPGGSGVTCYAGDMALVDDVRFQECSLKGSNVRINSASIFNVPANSLNPGGHAVSVGLIGGVSTLGRPASMTLQLMFSGKPVRLWGDGNTGVGVKVSSGGAFAYASGSVPTVTGTAGDFSLAGAAQNRPFNEGTGAYDTLRNRTWALLATAIGGGGYGGNAHNVERESHLIVLG